MKVTVVAGLAIWCALSVAFAAVWAAVMWLGKYHDPDWQEDLDEWDEEIDWRYEE
jgi:hypothetical protein